jgi:SAM-dependent methyltransferase
VPSLSVGPSEDPASDPAGRLESHEHRRVAESFGAEAERYDRSRPSYPQAMIDYLVGASPGSDFLDVGTGTGIAARQFQAAGARVLGVDVDPRMADLARGYGLEVEVGRFESWDPAGRRFDAVIAGQAWHWVDPVAGAAKAAEALRSGGMLAVFWNAGHPPEDLTAEISAIYRRLVPNSLMARGISGNAADGYAILCSRAMDGLKEVGLFGEPETKRFEWERSYTTEEWLDVLPTQGDHSQFAPEKLQELLADIGTAIDALGGSFPMSYTTLVAAASVD